MKFLSIYTPDANAASAPPSKEHMARMGKLVEESRKQGTLLATGMLLPDANGGIRVRRAANETSVSEKPGPLAAVIGRQSGFAILQAKAREEVIEVTKRFLEVAGDGECELCPIQEPGSGCGQA